MVRFCLKRASASLIAWVRLSKPVSASSTTRRPSTSARTSSRRLPCLTSGWAGTPASVRRMASSPLSRFSRSCFWATLNSIAIDRLYDRSGVAMTVAVLGFKLLGASLRDIFDPRLRGA